MFARLFFCAMLWSTPNRLCPPLLTLPFDPIPEALGAFLAAFVIDKDQQIFMGQWLNLFVDRFTRLGIRNLTDLGAQRHDFKDHHPGELRNGAALILRPFHRHRRRATGRVGPVHLFNKERFEIKALHLSTDIFTVDCHKTSYSHNPNEHKMRGSCRTSSSWIRLNRSSLRKVTASRARSSLLMPARSCRFNRSRAVERKG